LNSPLASESLDPSVFRQLHSDLAGILSAPNLLIKSEDVIPYECDGLSAYRQRPMLVALPEDIAGCWNRTFWWCFAPF